MRLIIAGIAAAILGLPGHGAKAELRPNEVGSLIQLERKGLKSVPKGTLKWALGANQPKSAGSIDYDEAWLRSLPNGKGGEPFDAGTYACRPPGAHHGPFKSENGCVLFEIHYYDPA